MTLAVDLGRKATKQTNKKEPMTVAVNSEKRIKRYWTDNKAIRSDMRPTGFLLYNICVAASYVIQRQM